MQAFPAVDPIPLPAPIWLFKLLHIVTLSLHFVAVEMLLGGLLLAVLFSLFRGSPGSLVVARALARRLTVVMTYVINLGVPPLLFAQVLYGRALYTSSVLIGAYWISIILLLTVTYWLLYQFSGRLEAGRSAWWVGLSAWVLAGFIARLLSTNMTLMLRPEIWRQMYSASGAGVYLPTGDPTLTPRWLLMMTGGLFIAGLWLVYLAGRSTFTAEEKRFAGRVGGIIAAISGAAYLLDRHLGRQCAACCSQGRAAFHIPFINSQGSPATAGWLWSWSPCCSARSLASAELRPAGWDGQALWLRSWWRSPSPSIATASAT